MRRARVWGHFAVLVLTASMPVGCLEFLYRAGPVNRAVDWRWSSARWDLEHKSVGLPIRWPPGMECEVEFNVD